MSSSVRASLLTDSTCHSAGTRSSRHATSPHIALNSGGSCADAAAEAARANTGTASARFTGVSGLSARAHRRRMAQPFLDERHQARGRLLGRLLLRLDSKPGRAWLLVGVGDARERSDLA